MHSKLAFRHTLVSFSHNPLPTSPKCTPLCCNWARPPKILFVPGSQNLNSALPSSDMKMMWSYSCVILIPSALQKFLVHRIQASRRTGDFPEPCQGKTMIMAIADRAHIVPSTTIQLWMNRRLAYDVFHAQIPRKWSYDALLICYEFRRKIWTNGDTNFYHMIIFFINIIIHYYTNN